MITLLLHLLRLVPFFCGGNSQLVLENLALRQLSFAETSSGSFGGPSEPPDGLRPGRVREERPLTR